MPDSRGNSHLVVLIPETAVDLCLHFSYIHLRISLTKDAVGEGTPRGLERVRCPRAGPYTPLSGGSGINLPAL
jgi:hypothetical protein